MLRNKNSFKMPTENFIISPLEWRFLSSGFPLRVIVLFLRYSPTHKILLEITDTTDAVFQPADGRLTSLVDIIVI